MRGSTWNVKLLKRTFFASIDDKFLHCQLPWMQEPASSESWEMPFSFCHFGMKEKGILSQINTLQPGVYL